jgi:antitoxin HicB
MHEKELKYYSALPYRFDCRFDAEDRVWIVEYPELRGCSAHGATVRQAMSRGEAFKTEWIRTALEAGDHVPEPKQSEYSGKLLVRLPKTLHEQVAEDAAGDDVSINAYIVQAVTEKVQRTGLRNVASDIASHFTGFMQNTSGIMWGDAQKIVSVDKLGEMPKLANA